MKPPLIERLKTIQKEERISFHTPGHKAGAFFDQAGDGGLQQSLYRWDTTEIFGTDQLQQPEEVLKASQQWTADIFRSPKAYYLINGATAGILSMMLSQTKPKDEILLPRDVHQSVIHGLILGDLTPRFIQPEMDRTFGIPMGLTAKQVEEGLTKFPRIKGVLLTHPNYYGRASEIAEIRGLTAKMGIGLWVDQAHGAHLGLDESLPLSAVDAGADVTVMSFHKTLPAMTQTAVLFAGDGADRDRLQQQLNIHQSSSPSYVLMASIEQAAALYQSSGPGKMQELLDALAAFREKFRRLELFQLDRTEGKDPTKIWIQTEAGGLDGEDVKTYLREAHNIEMELSMPQGVLAAASIANSKKDLEKLYLAFEELEKTLYNKGKMEKTSEVPQINTFEGEEAEASGKGEAGLPPGSVRFAFYSPKERVSINHSLGRIAAGAVTPYPPGIPMILPGERITRPHIDRLLMYQEKNLPVNGIIEGKILITSEE